MAGPGFQPRRAHMTDPAKNVLSSLEQVLIPAFESAGYSLRNDFGMRHGSWVISFQNVGRIRRVISAGLTPMNREQNRFEAEFWVSLENSEGKTTRRTVDEFLIENGFDTQKILEAVQNALRAAEVQQQHRAIEGAY